MGRVEGLLGGALQPWCSLVQLKNVADGKSCALTLTAAGHFHVIQQTVTKKCSVYRKEPVDVEKSHYVRFGTISTRLNACFPENFYRKLKRFGIIVEIVKRWKEFHSCSELGS